MGAEFESLKIFEPRKPLVNATIAAKMSQPPPIVTAIVAMSVLMTIADALYFHIAETERKCFIEEIPDETMVTGKSSGNVSSLFTTH